MLMCSGHTAVLQTTLWVELSPVVFLSWSRLVLSYSTRRVLLGLLVHLFFRWEVPEWMFMSIVWTVFNLGRVFLSISEEYYRYCETAASNLALVIARNLSYLLMLYYSLSRCLQFPILQTDNNQEPLPETHIAASETNHPLNPNHADRPNGDSGMS